MNHTRATRTMSAMLVVLLLAGPFALPVQPSVALASTQPIPEFRFSGTGWGHGIGMSQYGAKGFAEAGHSYGAILRHYYSGVSISTVSQKTVQVNLDRAASRSNGGFTRASWRVRPGRAGNTLVVAGKTYPDATYTFVASGSSVVMRDSGGNPLATFSGPVDVSSGSPSLTQIVDASGPFAHTFVRYRGTLRISASAGNLKLLNRLGMEDYLRGVVPREMPSSWHMEALKAQSVAARSYAYVDGTELYCTTASQVYNGHSKGSNRSSTEMHETSRTNQAIDATAHRVVKYGSNVVKTFFFSQSGGYTANNEDVWAGAALPYLRSVRDPHERAAGAPRVPWPAWREAELVWDGSALAATLRSKHGTRIPASPAFVSGITLDRAPSGHVRTITYRFSTGASFTRTGEQTRSDLGLWSPAFRVSSFPIERIYGSNRYATAVAVSNTAFPQGGQQTPVVLASGQDYADALVGSAVAGAVGGTLLLTRAGLLPDVVAAEMRRLGTREVYVMGGAAAIAPAVVTQVEQALGLPTGSEAITRIGGRNRYETAALAADFVHATAGSRRAILVSGSSWPDAASASALAYGKGYPILFTGKETLNPHAESYLASRRPERVLVIGGTAVISSDVEQAVQTATGRDVRRLGGSNRYVTSALVARQSVWPEGFSKDIVYVATGADYADALAGGTLAGATKRPMVLTARDRLDSGTAAFINAQDVKSDIELIRIIGGPAVVTQRVTDAIDELMTR